MGNEARQLVEEGQPVPAVTFRASLRGYHRGNDGLSASQVVGLEFEIDLDSVQIFIVLFVNDVENR